MSSNSFISFSAPETDTVMTRVAVGDCHDCQEFSRSLNLARILHSGSNSKVGINKAVPHPEHGRPASCIKTRGLIHFLRTVRTLFRVKTSLIRDHGGHPTGRGIPSTGRTAVDRRCEWISLSRLLQIKSRPNPYSPLQQCVECSYLPPGIDDNYIERLRKHKRSGLRCKCTEFVWKPFTLIAGYGKPNPEMILNEEGLKRHYSMEPQWDDDNPFDFIEYEVKIEHIPKDTECRNPRCKHPMNMHNAPPLIDDVAKEAFVNSMGTTMSAVNTSIPTLSHLHLKMSDTRLFLCSSCSFVLLGVNRPLT